MTHLDARRRRRCGARRGSGSRRGRRRSCPSSSAIRRAAARVARRRGSSTTMRRSPSHGSSSSASGTTVVLPAPGGADDDGRGPGRRGRRGGRRGSRRSAGRGARTRRAGDGRAQPSAGDPWNGPGSPTTGMSGVRQAVAVGDRLGDGSPRRRAPPLGGGRHRAVDADEHERRELGQAERLDRQPVRVGEHEELLDSAVRGRPWRRRSSAVTRKLTRASEPRRPSRMRVAVGRIHELSLVYGSSTTVARWNVVSHSSSGTRLGTERGQHEVHRWVRRHGVRR